MDHKALVCDGVDRHSPQQTPDPDKESESSASRLSSAVGDTDAIDKTKTSISTASKAKGTEDNERNSCLV